MPTCRGCHERFQIGELSAKGYCDACLTERLRLRNQLQESLPAPPPSMTPGPLPDDWQRAARHIILTTETALDIGIEARLGIVTAEAVIGMNILKDVMMEIRDLAGGRSQTQQRAMRDTRDALFDCLRHDAARLGADMVIAVSLSWSDFGSRGSALMAVAMGTAVRLSKPASANNAPQL